MMQVRAGQTRLVLLVGSWAIKMARIRLLPTVWRLMRAPFRFAWFKARLLAAVANPTGARAATGAYLLDEVFGGIRANWQEERLSREHPEWPLAPVVTTLLWGMILVMRRGEPIPHATSEVLRAAYASDYDLSRPEHVCLLAGRLVYVDYGNPKSLHALQRA